MSYSTQPRLTRHLLGFPPLGMHYETEAAQHAPSTAVTEAVEREMALVRALNPPPAPTLTEDMIELRRPILPDDFAQRVEALDSKIYERGVVVDRDKLFSLGKDGFEELREADRQARGEQRVFGIRTDFTDFASVFLAFARAGCLTSLPVPQRTTSDQANGHNVELDAVRKVESFDDLWKCFGSEPRAVRYVYGFRDVFESLVFGHSLFTWIEANGRVYHKFFASGASGNKVKMFWQWVPVLKGTHYRVKITNPLWSVVSWLADETELPPDILATAQHWFGLRVPSAEQITLTQAVLDGFALGLDGWHLWEFVGRIIRRLPDRYAVGEWRKELRRYRNINGWYRELMPFFRRAVTNRFGGCYQFEPTRHRAFVTRTLAQLRDSVSAVVAMTIEENSPADAAPVVARFRDWILCSGKPKAQLGERIDERLNAVFVGSNFKAKVEVL